TTAAAVAASTAAAAAAVGFPCSACALWTPVRICHDCSPATLRENDFYDRHLRLLIAGAHFLVTVVPDTGAALPHCCRLSSDHR
ncbi:hypothetical protein MTO96_042298, partial [Rhipicephalus appendiculatus]